MTRVLVGLVLVLSLSLACARDRALDTPDAGQASEPDVASEDVADTPEPDPVFPPDAEPSPDDADVVGPPDVEAMLPDTDVEDEGEAPCVASEEVCDGMDNDCDGQIDESLVQTCTSRCGEGQARCVDGQWRDCDALQPATEVCNDVDDDCDNEIDEGLARRCTSSCGAGQEFCRAGRWRNCNAPQPEPEVCDGEDNDCDGQTDEGLPAILHSRPSAEILAQHELCVAPEYLSGHCMSASHRWCSRESGGCHSAGVGLMGAVQGELQVLCMPSGVRPVSATYAEITEATDWEVNNDLLVTPLAHAVSHDWCRHIGFAAGAGIVEYSNPNIFMVCLEAEQVAVMPVDSNAMAQLGCNVFLGTSGLACNSVAQALCQQAGHLSGIGPVLEDGATHLVCLRD